MRPVRRRRPPEGDPQLEHLAGLLATAISEIRSVLEATREARDLAAEIHHLTVEQRIEPDRLAAVAHDVKAARNAAEAGRQAGEFILAAVQSLVAVHNEQAREKAAAAQEPPAPAPEAAPAPAKPAARGKTGERA